ncbi:GntR family transcriptional regulator [Cytobacillus firmus]|uniref:GntR family transcriptional regulator n=1 Tax=Cytobacillus firmus TaxID=1399 RepID=UPI00222849B0|nr:GntR family transcriptional regulator [Cytobacillus firmus]
MSFENTTLSQRISEEIAIKISEGALKPGDRLLELELTKEFGTSRAPIREALFILEKEGIVERVPRKGVFVKKRTKKELIDLYEVVYRLLEIAITKLKDSRTDEQLKKIENLINNMGETLEGNKVKQCFDLLEELQKDFFIFSGNTVLEDLYMRINSQLIPFRYISLSYPTSMDHSIGEYQEILIGLKEKDLQKILASLKRKEKRALAILEKFVDSQ